MTREEALKAWEQMYSEIDKDNWLFVGTINPQMVEWAIKALADRKTELSLSDKPTSSEKPNNCEKDCFLCKWLGDVDVCGRCRNRNLFAEADTEPTISKMEQVEKPQTCDTCKYGEDKHRYAHICNECGVGINNYEPKGEPQTDTGIAKAIVHKMIDDAVIAEDAYPDLRQKMHDAVDEYEPQTDYGDFADRLAYERGVKHAWEVAQKVFNSTVTFYEAEDVAKQVDKDINVRSKDEQTEREGE